MQLLRRLAAATAIAALGGCSVEHAPTEIPTARSEDAVGDPRAAELLEAARVRPLYEGKEMVGLTISGIVPGSRWDELGVRDGDTLVAVEDIQLRSPGATAEALTFIAAHGTALRAVRLSEQGVALRLADPE